MKVVGSDKASIEMRVWALLPRTISFEVRGFEGDTANISTLPRSLFLGTRDKELDAE